MRSSWLGSPGSVPLCVVLAACGARASLPSGEAAAGGAAAGGAATSSTTSSTASSGGAGGAVTPTCEVLVVDGPPLSPVWANGNKQMTPWLAWTEPDGSRAGLVYTEAYDPSEEFLLTSSVALGDPWGAWPSSLGSSAPHGLTDGFVVGPAGEGRFSMLTTDEPKNASDDPTGMVVWAPKAGVPGAAGQFFDDVPPGSPLLVTSNGDDFLAGFQRLVGDDLHHLTLGRIVIGGGPFSFGDAVACSLGAPLSGAAVPSGDGFLAVLSNGRPFAHCLTDDLADGPPTRLQLVVMTVDPSNAALMYEDDEPERYVSQAHLVPTAGGAWAAWERIPFQPSLERSIQILRVDGAGAPVNGKLIEVSYGTIAAPFAIADLGGGFAIATVSAAGVVEVHALSGDGAPFGEASFAAGDGFALDLDVALLGSPSRDHLLVAWSESSIVNNDDQRVRVARLACAGGL